MRFLKLVKLLAVDLILEEVAYLVHVRDGVSELERTTAQTNLLGGRKKGFVEIVDTFF